MNQRQGCLSGILQLLTLQWLFDWAQGSFGFGRGGCIGAGCGMILLVVFLALVCSTLSGTDWSRFGLAMAPVVFWLLTRE